MNVGEYSMQMVEQFRRDADAELSQATGIPPRELQLFIPGERAFFQQWYVLNALGLV